MTDLLLARIAARIFPNVVWRSRPGGVYLTFDDGPDPGVTPHLLEMLDAMDCRVTFFMTGVQAEHHPEIVKNAIAQGHTIGTHGYDHESLLLAPNQKASREIGQSITALENITGRRPSLYRPPYGRFNPFQVRLYQEMGLTIVLWSVNPLDYRETESTEIIDRIARNTRDGDIILLHDRGPNADRTLNALPEIVEAIRQKGLNLLPLPADYSAAVDKDS